MRKRFELNLQNFADEEEQKPTEENNSLADIIKKQKEMIEKMVSKDDYEKLREEKNKLADIILEGGSYDPTTREEDKVDIEGLAKHIFNTQNQDNNLEFVKNALKYREAILDEKGIDVFAPKQGYKNNILDSDYATAVKVADVLQQCVDASDGDSGVFTAKLQCRLNDTGLLFNRKRR